MNEQTGQVSAARGTKAGELETEDGSFSVEGLRARNIDVDVGVGMFEESGSDKRLGGRLDRV